MGRNFTPYAMFKGCPKCSEQDRAQFYASNTTSYCKRCHKDAVLRSRLAKKGMTPEEEAHMAALQEHRCAICREEHRAARSLHMDHCHATGKARALLCGRCNQTLGRVKDDPAILQAMLDYLNKYK